jgi:BirA family biotin operon repressor/biotin-[acetyl-CoA-carboxylase] ligase
MSTKYQVLAMLEEYSGEFLSGEQISEHLQLSRTSVWKAVKALQSEGYQITAVTNKGYCLAGENGDILSEYEIQKRRNGCYLGHRVILLEQVDSTNQYAKRFVDQQDADGIVVIAEEQLNGKGRLSRHFYSPGQDGVYFSVILRPRLHLDELNLLTLTAAMGVVNAVERLTGIRPGIKWPNDVVYHGKKLCGILTESMIESETGKVEWLISGIGININNEVFPEELEDIACSIKQVCGHTLKRCDLLCAVLEEMEKLIQEDYYLIHREEMLKQYQNDLDLLGKEIEVRYPDTKVLAEVLGVDFRGGLIIRPQGGSQTVIYSGEVSIRNKE